MQNSELTEQDLLNCCKTLTKLITRTEPLDESYANYIRIIIQISEIITDTSRQALAQDPNTIPKVYDFKPTRSYETEDDITKLRRVFEGYNFEE